MRMENLDLLRTSVTHAQSIIDDLHWLGLDWDEGSGSGAASGAGNRDSGTAPCPVSSISPNAFWQSERRGFYEKCVDTLSAQGLVYPCFCSRAELHAAEAPHLADGAYLYSGKCRRLTPPQRENMANSRLFSLRMQVPDKTIAFTDGCLGAYSQNLAAACGDFILRRSDGVFAYQLATPADDGNMGVTEVVRGSDLLSSTPRQIWLLEQLGFAPPRYYHFPLLLSPDGKRLAKRDGVTDFADYRAAHARPEALLGHLAALAGLIERPEPLTARDLLPHFNWNKIPKKDILLTAETYAALLA